ncbi:MAG: FkbM family methyltransferase [Bacteroidota bacterium]
MNIFEIKKQFIENKLDKWKYIDQMYSVHRVLFDYAEFIKTTNISNIQISEGQIVMTFRDSSVQFICSEGDKRLAPFDTLNFGIYEQQELQMQLNLMNEGDTIFDIGANYGWYALHIAKAFPKSSIFSFEPIPSTFEKLNANIQLNQVANIEALNFGFSEEPGSFDFFFDPALSVNASLARVSDSATVEKVECKVQVVDDFVRDMKLKVDFIKCDVEGAELLVFKGARKLLLEQKPIVFSEMLRKWTAKFNYHPNDIIHLFKESGYACFTIEENQLARFEKVDDNTIETNYFFLHEEKHKQKIEALAR